MNPLPSGQSNHGLRPLKLGFSLWSQATGWPALRDAAARIDALGYDYIFTQDHLLATFGDSSQPILEGWTLLAALAVTTSNAELGILVSANTFRNPGLLAKMVATLDHLSAGRAILGLGAGWFEPEHTAHGIGFGHSPGERLRWLDASTRVIRALLDGQTVDEDEPHARTVAAHHAPRPIRPHLPILIGGSGERRTLLTAARYADIWNGLGTPEVLGRKCAVLDAHCATIGRDPASIERSVTCKMIIRDDPGEARRVWESALAANLTRPDIEPDPWLGPPEAMAERIHAYRSIGITTVVVSMPWPYDVETIERLTGEVRPLATPSE